MSEIRVVVIEDHNLTRIGLRAALETREDIKIVGEASNGIDGLNLLKSLKPDVATIDLGLPDIDGIELTRRFRQYQAEIENQDTKLLILTMQNSDEAVLAAFGAGADSYCMKDIESEKLVEAVEATASSGSWIESSNCRYCTATSTPRSIPRKNRCGCKNSRNSSSRSRS